MCGHGISIPSASKRSLSRLRSSPVSAHWWIGLVSASILISTPESARRLNPLDVRR